MGEAARQGYGIPRYDIVYRRLAADVASSRYLAERDYSAPRIQPFNIPRRNGTSGSPRGGGGFRRAHWTTYRTAAVISTGGSLAIAALYLIQRGVFS